MPTVFIEKMVSDAVRVAGVKVQRLGPAGNVFACLSLSDLFQVGHLLFDKGCFLYPAADYARKQGKTRQAVDNWIWRDAQRIALVYNPKGKKSLTFVVEAP